MPRRAGENGFVLIALIALLAMGGLYFFISNLTPEAIEARRQAKTEAALMQAREALIGYAVRYREDQINDGQLDRVYGYLPLPDLGSSNNNNIDPKCKDASNNPLEGCDAASNATNFTVIGRFPWRMLGTEPLRDGNGECLWYIVSGSHDRIQRPAPMNWDTLGHLDVVTTTDTEKLKSLIASPHDRPIAIIFSAGPQLGTQNRGPIGADVVTECGGNYNPSNYLDPSLTSTLLNYNDVLTTASAYFAGGTSIDTATINLAIATQGRIVKEGATTLKKACAPGTSCDIVANDIGLTITSEILFGAIRKSSSFRTEINSMLSAIERCLNKEVAKWDDPSSPPSPRPFDFEPLVDNTNAPLASPTGKKVGRLKTCFSDADDPKGYFSHYRDQVFLAGCDSGTCITATIDESPTQKDCAGVIVFGGQRTATQSRTGSLESFENDALGGSVQVQQRNNPANYLEGVNLESFKTTGSNPFEGFDGDSEFRAVAYPQGESRDIVRCITGEKPFTPVPNPNLASDKQLTTYDPVTGTLTLGSVDVTTSTYPAAALYGCSWTPTAYSLGSGMRLYYRFNIINGGDGYVFAMIDGDRNSGNPCGAARQHLGYSGENADTPYIDWPKLGVEFDTRSFSERNNYSEIGDPLSNGRSDPCYRAACGNPTQNLDYDSHVAIVYWGNQAATAGVTTPRQDDNVHGFPTPPDTSARPAPRNPVVDPWPNPAVPAIPGGVTPLNRLSDTTQTRDFHVRVELTRVSTNTANRSTTYKIQTWVVAESITAANQIAAMKTTSRPMSVLYPTLAPLVQDTPTVYDIQGGLCSAGCGAKEVCDSTDGMCYQPAFKNVRLGFTNAQSSRDQVITISDFVPTWIP